MVTTAPLGKMIIELGLDSTDFGKSLQSSKREVRYWSNDMRASMRAADMAGNTLGKFEARHNGLTKVIEAQRKTVDRLKQSYDNSFVDGKPTAQTEKLAAQLRNAESQLINYNKQLVNNAGEMAKWKVENEGITGSLNKFGKTLTKRGDQMAKFGDSMTKRVTLPIVAGVGAVVKAAMDWESAWAGVQKTNDEVVDANGNVVYSYEQLEGELRALTKELPATHAEIAGVAEAAGQLGIQTESVSSFTKTMIDLGESTNLSSEQAATSLARLANITQMSQDDFDRLGSAIVEVGNNFATTEAEITELAMRLAAAGSQVGMSEADIVGLAGALSSVGVEAQAGGTAFSKVMIEMQLAAAQGGDELEAFAKVAGMSADDFKRAFEEDAVGAISAFIEGLSQAEEKGTSAIEILDEMGISEVRLRDSLLRAGNASELFARAIDMSNDAWEENTALSTEANIRYETLESQLGMLRNEVYDTAIEFGGPFVQALRDGITVSRPFLERLADMASAFSDMDPEMQQTIIRTLAITAAFGPLMSVTGRLASGFGGLTTKTIGFIGEISKKRAVADMTKELATATTVTGKFGGAAATAGGAKGVGALTGALGALGPVGWGIVGAGGLLAAGYGAWKLWGEEAYEAAERTKQWGTDVSEETHKVLTDFQEMSEEASNATWKMSMDTEEGASQATAAYSKMAEEISESARSTIAEQEETFARLPGTVRGIMQDIVNDRIADQQKIIDEAESLNSEINKIYSNAVSESRSLTAAELQIVEDYHSRLTELRSETLELGAEQQAQVHSVMLDDLKSFSVEQLETRREYLTEELRVSREMFSEIQEELDQSLVKGEISQHEHNMKMQDLNEAQKESNMFFAKEFVKIWNERGDSIERQEGILSEFGLTYSEVMNELNIDSALAATGTNLLAESLEGMTEETRDANKAWNDFILDEKTGEVHTNVTEIVQEASESEEGWNNLEFILKNANLTSSAKETIKEALEANGTWEKMDFNPKAAELFTNAQGTAMEYLKANGDWQELTFQEKNAILDTNTPEQLKQILQDFGLWNRLDPSVQKMIVTSDASQRAREGRQAINDWNSNKPRPLALDVTTNASSVATAAQRAIDRVRGKTVRIKTVHSVTGAPSSGPYATGLAKGTNYHKGGPAIVNDQRGSKFRELITYPDGRSFVPHGRNVLLDLPKGSKVFRASLTEKLLPGIPQYANGVGIPSDSTVIQNINRVNSATQSRPVQINNNFGQLESLLRQMLNAISRLQPKIDINVENWGETDPRTINESLEFLTQINERGNLQ